MTEWTTRNPPELTRPYGVEELHTVCFAPKGWPGKGATVSLGIPECEMIWVVAFQPNGEPVMAVNQPQENLNVRYWTRTACKRAAKQQAFISFSCDTAEQAKVVARRAAHLLPTYQRVALERMYDPATRANLS